MSLLSSLLTPMIDGGKMNFEIKITDILEKRLRTRTLRTCESNMPLEFKGSETNLTSPLISELSSGEHTLMKYRLKSQ